MLYICIERERETMCWLWWREVKALLWTMLITRGGTPCISHYSLLSFWMSPDCLQTTSQPFAEVHLSLVTDQFTQFTEKKTMSTLIHSSWWYFTFDQTCLPEVARVCRVCEHRPDEYVYIYVYVYEYVWISGLPQSIFQIWSCSCFGAVRHPAKATIIGLWASVAYIVP